MNPITHMIVFRYADGLHFEETPVGCTRSQVIERIHDLERPNLKTERVIRIDLAENRCEDITEEIAREIIAAGYDHIEQLPEFVRHEA